MIMVISTMSKGTAYGIGVGPGDSELLTLKAFRLIQECPVLAWPATLENESTARAIAEPHIPADRIEIPIRMPMVESRFPAQDVYDQAAVEIGGHLSEGRDVAVLCEGDPFFYGSFMYLFARLSEHHSVEVVPGVSSLTAVPAALGVPLASRNDVLTVLPGPLDEDVLTARLRDCEAAAIIKVGRHLPKIRRVLETLGLLDNARYVQHATMEKQLVEPLANMPADMKAPYFSMVIVHRRGEAWRLS